MSDYYGPVPLWWWSGAPLHTERLNWQLDRLMDGGIRQAVVISLAPTGPLWGCPGDEPEFMSDEWWEIFTAVCAHAERRGFGLWFYDQLGFSGANIQGRVVAAHPSARGQRLTREGPVASGFDYLNPDACALLFDAVHGELERRVGHYFGTVLKGTFQDELPSIPSWTAGFSDAFASRRGYRLEPHIEALWSDIGADTGPVRRDYQLTRAELAEEAFFKPLHDWHAERGLLVGCDQQEPARGGHTAAGVRYYADYARTHRWFSAPGSDHWGDGKRHSSLAHAHGHSRTWIEAFHSTGWGGTLEETLDWLIPWLRAGANLYNPHAVYYSTEQGRFDWAPPSTCWRQPYWRHYPVFAETVATLCEAVAEGTHVCDVALLDPVATVQHDLPPFADEEPFFNDSGDWPTAHRTYQDLAGWMTWHDFRTGLLDRLGIDFDVLDEPSIQKAGAAMTLAGERYRVVVLPAARVLEPATARVLVEFAQAGGTLIAVGELPQRAAGRGDDDTEVERLRRLFTDGAAIACADLDEAATALSGLPRRVDADVPTLLREAPDGSHLLLVPAVYPMATKASLAGDTFLSGVYTFEPPAIRDKTVTITGDFTSAEAVALTGGAARPLPVERDGDRLRVTVSFDEAPVALIRLTTEVPTEPAPAPTPSRRLALDGDWTGRPESTLDYRHGDFPGPDAIQIWRMDGQRATFGEWATLRRPGGDWEPVTFSQTWGPGDKPDGFPRVHDNRGYVPEEFITIGTMRTGDTAELRAELAVDAAGEYVLVVGAPTAKTITVDGEELPAGNGYHAECPVTLSAGRHRIEVTFTALTDEVASASYVLMSRADWRPRPQWLRPATEAPVGTTFHSDISGTVRVLLATVGDVVLRLNGKELARHGEFDNYTWRRMPRMAIYDSTVAAGDNHLSLEFGDTEAQALVEVSLPGDKWVVSGSSGWDASVVDHRMHFDPQVLTARPRPRPDTAPLTSGDTGQRRLRLRLPPGTVELTVPARAEFTASFRGAPLPVAEPIRLPQPASGGEVVELSFPHDDRWPGGAQLTGPVTVHTQTGPVTLGDWAEIGLGDFSGALVYETEVSRPAPVTARLHLGEVRGTAEVHVNGEPAGVRPWSPYTFEVRLAAGTNRLAVTVHNTLAPYLAAVNPLAGTLPGQERSGLFGPVSLEVFDD
ncbi:glycoside hydrolase [Stackebrandtia nassauensis]|uniref:Glycoside hydrolase family 2 sugar binding protein n=1 Tax=Stackebrandtia nassauensis (strain DSM 44728 / CIP 108903 / NRRL B-16338 / NBRC 102104 / LLR-40K-21) TaxID=446470 RepID=D3PUD7_STANL|nr:glycoside hydrolase [Stackebrandtia nassauensis]ADD42950.1 glycoside hydrolase family 2 sugar binding protein [Stackebrandtia nassauensis DSM 44728]